MSRLRQLMILSRDVSKSRKFYEEGLGLKVIRSSESFVEFDTNSALPLAIKQVDNEASCSSGYSPFLNFDVQDMNTAITQLLPLGAILDGPIKYPAFGKVASLRTPDGNMIGLFEPTSDI